MGLNNQKVAPLKNGATTEKSWFGWWSKEQRCLTQRVTFAVSILWIFACVVFVGNNISARVVPQNGNIVYYFGPLFPTGQLAGHDFWAACAYADLLRRGLDYRNLPNDIPEKMKPVVKMAVVYPPLVFILYFPYLLMPYPVAYTVQMSLLFFANIGVIFLAGRMAGKIGKFVGPQGEQCVDMFPYMIIASLSFMAVSSYGFFFSIERGNCDIFSAALSWLFLYWLIEKPKQMWIQALLLACAINIKITPAIFVPLLFWRHGWKCLFPLLVINVSMLFAWGPENARNFLVSLKDFAATPVGWWGDHSAYSFAYCVLKPLGFSVIATERALIILSLFMWGIAAIILWRRGLSPINLLLMFIISIPVMNILPNSSNDYKLVILFGPLTVLMMGFLYAYTYGGKRWALLGVFLEFGIIYWLTQSGGLARSPYLANKFPFVLSLQLLIFLVVVCPFGLFAEVSNTGIPIKMRGTK